MQYFHGTPGVAHQYDNDNKKMTIVNRYARSVNMNSFALFSLVGEPATLSEYKDSRLLRAKHTTRRVHNPWKKKGKLTML